MIYLAKLQMGLIIANDIDSSKMINKMILTLKLLIYPFLCVDFSSASFYDMYISLVFLLLMLMTSTIEIKACLFSNFNMDISIINFIKYTFSKFYHRHAELIVNQNNIWV